MATRAHDEHIAWAGVIVGGDDLELKPLIAHDRTQGGGFLDELAEGCGRPRDAPGCGNVMFERIGAQADPVVERGGIDTERDQRGGAHHSAARGDGSMVAVAVTP